MNLQEQQQHYQANMQSQLTLPDLLRKMTEMGGSDLHITTNSSPQVRVHGHLHPLPEFPVLTPSETKSLAYSV